jgi:hypothetical protein
MRLRHPVLILPMVMGPAPLAVYSTDDMPPADEVVAAATEGPPRSASFRNEPSSTSPDDGCRRIERLPRHEANDVHRAVAAGSRSA